MPLHLQSGAARVLPSNKKQAVLSELDARIIEGIADGSSNVQLAAQLYLSRQGLEYRISRIMRQLRAPNRAALVARAHFLGILAVGSWPPRVPHEFIEGADDQPQASRMPSHPDQ